MLHPLEVFTSCGLASHGESEARLRGRRKAQTLAVRRLRRRMAQLCGSPWPTAAP